MRKLLLHPPKTAGATIKACLEHHDPDFERFVYPCQSVIKDGIIRNVILETDSWIKHVPLHAMNVSMDYPCILPVRNPYSRVCSMWAYEIKQRQKEGVASISLDQYLSTGYGYVVDNRVTHTPDWHPFKPCYYWYEELETEPEIIRFEHLEEDLEKIGAPIETFDYEYNYTIGWTVEHALSVLNEFQIRKINRVFSKDFELFGYEKV